jgi:FkbM family methyltransferase
MREVTLDEQNEKLYAYEEGFHALHLIYTGAKLGLFEKIHDFKDGVPPRTLAEELVLYEPYLRIWCQSAHHLGILDCDGDGRFRLAAHMDTLLVDTNHPYYFGHKPKFMIHHAGEDLKRHAEFLRSGDVRFYDSRGQDFSRDAKALSNQAVPMAMTFMVLPSIPGLKKRLEAGIEILDVGCGSGLLMIQMAQACPNCRFVGVEVDKFAIEDAQRDIREKGLESRVSARLVDAACMDYDGEFDLVTMATVLHEIRTDIRDRALANCHKALRDSGTIVVFDFSYPETGQDFEKREHSMGIMDQFYEMAWGSEHLSLSAREKLLVTSGFRGPTTMSLFGGSFQVAFAGK